MPSNKIDYHIRYLRPNEYHLIKDFTYQALFVKQGQFIPADILDQPEIKNYYHNFGLKDDMALAAVINEEVIGIVWTRIIKGEIKGYGYWDDRSPEFGISLLAKYRRYGIGTKLMKEMLKLLKENGYSFASLSVQKDNPAVKLYQKLGFKIEQRRKEECLMSIKL